MNAPEAVKSEIKYASFNLRMLACTVDLFIVMLVALPFTNWVLDSLISPFDLSDINELFNKPEILTDPGKFLDTLWQVIRDHHLIERSALENLLQGIFLAAYILPFWFYYSTTPGKMLLRMEIQDVSTGLPLTRKQAVTRFFAYIVSMLPFALGFVWVAFNKKKQGFHDILANTVVTVKPKKDTVIKQL